MCVGSKFLHSSKISPRSLKGGAGSRQGVPAWGCLWGGGPVLTRHPLGAPEIPSGTALWEHHGAGGCQVSHCMESREAQLHRSPVRWEPQRPAADILRRDRIWPDPRRAREEGAGHEPRDSISPGGTARESRGRRAEPSMRSISHRAGQSPAARWAAVGQPTM